MLLKGIVVCFKICGIIKKNLTAKFANIFVSEDFKSAKVRKALY